MRPLLLDLFCGAGGAAVGYHRAGFDVVGIDINPQPNYPFEFRRHDALRTLEETLWPLAVVDAIHASPPCQAYSQLRGLSSEKPKLIAEVRSLLRAIGLPWVIENVRGASPDMLNPITLCGSAFGLGVWRHRLFEMSHPPLMVPQCQHNLCPEPLDVTGTGGPFMGIRKSPGGGISRKPGSIAEAREAMGIDWMTRREINESIPPAYTEWIGKQIIGLCEKRGAA